MHPVSVSIPSFRPENNPMEKGFTVGCRQQQPLCVTLVRPPAVISAFSFHSDVASVSCWDGFGHLWSAPVLGFFDDKIGTRDREGISCRPFCPETPDKCDLMAHLELWLLRWSFIFSPRNIYLNAAKQKFVPCIWSILPVQLGPSSWNFQPGTLKTQNLQPKMAAVGLQSGRRSN